jgi:hypothetical protein
LDRPTPINQNLPGEKSSKDFPKVTTSTFAPAPTIKSKQKRDAQVPQATLNNQQNPAPKAGDVNVNQQPTATFNPANPRPLTGNSPSTLNSNIPSNYQSTQRVQNQQVNNPAQLAAQTFRTRRDAQNQRASRPSSTPNKSPGPSPVQRPVAQASKTRRDAQNYGNRPQEGPNFPFSKANQRGYKPPAVGSYHPQVQGNQYG